MKIIRPFFILLTSCVFGINAWGQRSEIWKEQHGTWLLNAGLGATRYLGDLNERDNLAHLQLGIALNVAIAYRYSPQLSFRAEAQLYYIRGSQIDTHLAYNNLSFRSLNPDIWVGVQWDFWKASDRNKVVIPYALVGVGLTYITPKTSYKGQSVSLAPLQTEGVLYDRLPFIIRYGLGVPVMATERFKLNLEGTYTHVLSDYLDDVSTVYPDRSQMAQLASALSDRRLELNQIPNVVGAQRGNPSRRDGYFVLSARLIFILSTSSQRNYSQMFGG
ncbi:hypothetical protein GCM10028807_08340 [Spirosoma daeguense]